MFTVGLNANYRLGVGRTPFAALRRCLNSKSIRGGYVFRADPETGTEQFRERAALQQEMPNQSRRKPTYCCVPSGAILAGAAAELRDLPGWSPTRLLLRPVIAFFRMLRALDALLMLGFAGAYLASGLIVLLLGWRLLAPAGADHRESVGARSRQRGRRRNV